MPRTLGYTARRIALAITLTILGGAIVAYAMHCPAEKPAPAPLAAAPTIVAHSTMTEVAATEPAPAASSDPAPVSTPAPANAVAGTAMPYGSAGMVVGIDPETGKLGLPSKADRAALERAANLSPALDRSETGLVVVHKPDGSRMIDLKGRFQNYMVVRLTPDGRKTESCVEGPEVGKALEAPAAPAQGDEPTPSSQAQHEER